MNNGRFPRGSEDGEIFQNIRNGIRGTEMPGFSALSADAVWQMVAYLRSLFREADPRRDSDGARSGDPAAGELIFFGKGACANCHEVNGHGGIAGPDLSAAGKSTAEALRQAIVAPNPVRQGGDSGRRPPRVTIAKTKDGREIRGVGREDTFSLELRDAAGQLHLLDKQQLASLTYEARSLMPGDYPQRLSADEIRNVVAYLRTLTARDLSRTATADIPGGLTFERIRNSEAEPHNWLTYWGDYRGRHYSSLSQIDTSNVHLLQARWAVQMPGDSILEATPLMVDGIMYTTGPPGEVFAIDARTGRQIWRYQRKQKVVNPYEGNRFNRGVAVLGNRVFFGTLDAALVALDARTGLPLWEAQVADTMHGYSITEAPLAINGKIVVGVAGGEFGIRGFVDAYDARTGQRLWRFHTIPGPGEFGHETWKGDSWEQGGGATWLTGSYDPDLDILYWGVGNPGPDMDGEIRHGDNLFSCSVVALDAATGRRKWHYQFTPGDTHDWDANEDIILVDRIVGGQKRRVLLHADRNGFFYSLDGTTGTFLKATPFVRQTWAQGFDANGRPILTPGSTSSKEGSIPVYPDLGGGTNFQSPSYSAQTGWLYLAYQESGQRFFREPSVYEPGREYWGGSAKSLNEATSAGIRAIDPETGKIEWDFKIAQGSLNAGVLSTGGGLLFAATREGHLIALDARTGTALWRFQAGAAIAAAPMSYAVGAQQFVAVSAGNVLYSFALPGRTGP